MADRSRYEFLDVLKGIGIVLMVQVHCYGWWLDRPLRELPLFTASLVLGWFAAPIFLFVVGCALMLSMDGRQRAGQSHPAIALHILRRALLIFLGGYLLSFATFAGTPRASLEAVGVLQCIGLSIATAYAAARWLPRFGPSVAAMCVVLLTSVARDANWLQGTVLQPLLVNIPYQSNYAWLPWSAYALAGVDAGRLLVGTRRSQQDLPARLRTPLLLGLLLVLICGLPLLNYVMTLSGGKFPGETAVQYSFWYPLPQFNLFHSGWVLIEFTALAWLLHARESLPAILRPLTAMGRAALVVFVAHHLLGYRLLHALGQTDGVYGRFSTATATIWLVVMLGFSWVLAEIWLKYLSRGDHSSA